MIQIISFSTCGLSTLGVGSEMVELAALKGNEMTHEHINIYLHSSGATKFADTVPDACLCLLFNVNPLWPLQANTRG